MTGCALRRTCQKWLTVRGQQGPSENPGMLGYCRGLNNARVFHIYIYVNMYICIATVSDTSSIPPNHLGNQQKNHILL